MMSEINVICGDSLLELPKIEAASIDLVIADPPYNLGKEYGNNSDRQAFDDYLEFTRKWLRECKRVLKPHGTIYVFSGFRMVSYIYQVLEKELEMNFVNWICWHYTQGIGKTRGFSPRHDDILMFSKTPKYYFNLDAIRVPQKYYRSVNNMRGANPGDVWEFSHIHYCNANRQDHPTQKPEGLMERMLLASSEEGATVLDPFAGSGTTPRVCQQTGRRCVCVEINPDYAEMIRRRLETPFTGFDSIDPRMERVPNDLNDPEMRDEYFQNHVHWFLCHHENEIAKFWQNVAEKYGNRAAMNRNLERQTVLFEIDNQ